MKLQMICLILQLFWTCAPHKIFMKPVDSYHNFKVYVTEMGCRLTFTKKQIKNFTKVVFC